MRERAFTIAVVAAVGIWWSPASRPAAAQWLKLPLPGTPRTADGEPNLAAPAPRTPAGRPDLSGIWLRSDGRFNADLSALGIAVPFQPWAQALYKQRQDNLGKGRPWERCLPHGIPDAMLPNTPFKFVEARGMYLILYEEFVHYRQLFTDGRGLPQDPNPTWLGYSIAKWDGDTLVVETIGFNDHTWLNDAGYPHSDALRTTERFRRRDFGHLDVEFTIDDPKAYVRPWSFTVPFNLLPDTELIEFICDNEKDALHLVGK